MGSPDHDDTLAENLPIASTVHDGDGAASPAARPSLAPSGFNERYVHQRLLGEGGMGTVLLFRDMQIGRNVALKVMRTSSVDNAALRDRFVREARIQGQLEHPSIVPVYDLGTGPSGVPYFTMKRIRGVTMADILDGASKRTPEIVEKYPRRRVLSAFQSVCLAVDFAHRLGVLHRDLKPSNIMLGDFGEVYVLDWGLAKLGAGSDEPRDVEVSVPPDVGVTRPGVTLGTPGYMAPEQARGEPAVGPAVDIYALGAILFEILAGEPLHPTTSGEHALDSTRRGADARVSARAPARDVAPELDAICVKATALEPAARYASARELHDALESWFGGERDMELRKRLATEHADAAVAAVDSASTGSAADIDARRAAMREIGRALALDPTNARATTAMLRLLGEPPRLLPPEVRADLELAERQKTRAIGRFGTVAYASMLVYAPLLAWLGVRHWAPILAFYVAAIAACALSAIAAKSAHPSPRVVLAAMVLSDVGCAATSSLFGPLFFAPAAVAINTSAFIAHVPPEHRRFVLATGLVCVCAPIALDLLGITPSAYTFGPAGMTIAPGAFAMSELPIKVFLAFASIAMLLIAALSVVHIRDALGEAERRLMIHAWHMRGLVGASAPSEPPRDATA